MEHEISFAAFIMTYERPHVLLATIKDLFDQTIPPKKILVVDNSETLDTKNLISGLRDPRVEHLYVGYNSGPAGAAKIGLTRLVADGYHWVYWGDDDNPPAFKDSFEILLSILNNQSSGIGIIGAVGHYFNEQIGEIKRMPDERLLKAKLDNVNFIKVDSIAGGQTMIVNSEVVKLGVLPDVKLFFGFEELDFCMKVKRSGFDLFVSTDLFIRSRVKHAKFNYNHPLYVKKKIGELGRQYYSVRNILLILKFNKLYKAFLFQFFKTTVKMFYGFRFGASYGSTNLRMLGKGIWVGLFGFYGKRV